MDSKIDMDLVISTVTLGSLNAMTVPRLLSSDVKLDPDELLFEDVVLVVELFVGVLVVFVTVVLGGHVVLNTKHEGQMDVLVVILVVAFIILLNVQDVRLTLELNDEPLDVAVLTRTPDELYQFIVVTLLHVQTRHCGVTGIVVLSVKLEFAAAMKELFVSNVGVVLLVTVALFDVKL